MAMVQYLIRKANNNDYVGTIYSSSISHTSADQAIKFDNATLAKELADHCSRVNNNQKYVVIKREVVYTQMFTESEEEVDMNFESEE